MARTAVILAGVTMNLFLAFVIYTASSPLRATSVS